MTSLLNSKRGQARVYFGIMTFLFLFGFANIFAFALLGSFTDAFIATGFNDATTQQVLDNFGTALKVFDYVIVLLLGVFILGVALTSFRIATSPAFFVVQFFSMAFYGFVSYFFNHIFIQLVSDTYFTAAKVFFQNTLIICTNLHWVMLASFVVGVIAFFAKRERGQFLA